MPNNVKIISMRGIPVIIKLKKASLNAVIAISAVLSLFLFIVLFSCLFAGSASASSTAAKKQEIKDLEKQIKLELKTLKQIEAKINSIKGAQKAKAKKLIGLYSSMSSGSAAGILPHINKSLAVYILSGMTPRTASAIISRMSVKDAVYFTDRIGGK